MKFLKVYSKKWGSENGIEHPSYIQFYNPQHIISITNLTSTEEDSFEIILSNDKIEGKDYHVWKIEWVELGTNCEEI